MSNILPCVWKTRQKRLIKKCGTENLPETKRKSINTRDPLCENKQQCLLIQRYFNTVNDYAEKADLGLLESKKKLVGGHIFSEIIK